jgi:hypothetical protein
VRIHDENMPLQITTGPLGKTLHQRTKSASNINLRKQILAENNPNYKQSTDDSEIGKVSPGKLKYVQEQDNTAPMQRPAVRPLALKGSNMQTAAAVAAISKSQASEGQKKLAIKKSTKVLKDTAPPQHDSLPMEQYPVQQCDVRAADDVPARDDSALGIRQQELVPSVVDSTSEEYQPHVHNQAAELAHQASVAARVLPEQPTYTTSTPTIGQYEEDEEEDQDFMTARSFGLTDPTQELTTIFNPQHTKTSAAEIAEAEAFVETTRTQDDIDDEQWDTSMVAEYGEEIFEYMREMESRMSPNPFYMHLQQEIQWSMRGVLMDWVVQVHQRFSLLPETLFLTVNYIDRFLSCKIVSLGKLQLVGATAIFVAAKYEEVNCPTIAEIIYMVDNGYTAEELLKAERFMLSMLQFELGWPGPMSFLRRISKADDYDLETRTLAKYFLEVTIMDERFVGCKPSFLAAGAHCMSRLMLRKGDWTLAHVYYSNYTFRQLHKLLLAIWDCVQDGPKHHNAVYDKYTDKRYKRASTFVRGEMLKGFTLPFQAPMSLKSLGAQDWIGQ